RLVDEIVQAGAKRLNPFKLARGFQDLTGQHGREGDGRIDGADIGPGFGMMIDKLDRGCRETPAQAIPILTAYRFGQSQENENIGHAGGFPRRAGTNVTTCKTAYIVPQAALPMAA